MSYADDTVLKSRIMSCLASTNYYRLSAYWYPFREKDVVGKRLDSLQAGTHWEKVWNYYLFDRRLRTLLFDVISKTEIALRTQIAYHWSKDTSRTSPQRYTSSYKSNYKRQYLIKSIQETYDKSETDCAAHFRREKNIGNAADLPIWVFVEFSTFGNLAVLYSKGLKDATKRTIASYFGFSSADLFASILGVLRNVRNACAHQERIWNRRWGSSRNTPYLKNITLSDWHYTWDAHQQAWSPAAHGNVLCSDRATTAAILTFCHIIVRNIDPNSKWKERFLDLLATGPRSSFYRELGFDSAEWKSHPLWE